ncbi:MAG: ABC transporter permease [Anaerolineae bacterium]|nr:ABC transporter permease [Anaerolineae bacterium]
MLRPRWRKVLHDLWDNKVRTLLVVASIAVGVFAIGVIAGSYAMIAQDLSRSYASTNPANIVLVTSPFDPDFVDVIYSMDVVSEAEGRRHADLQIRLNTDKWDTITLIAIPDYDELTLFRHTLKQGVAVPGDQEVVLEHKSLALLGLEIGDTIRVELPDGTLRQLPIVGAVQDQSDVYGSILGDIQGYITYDTLEWLGQPTDLNRLLVTVKDFPNDKNFIRSATTAITDRIEKSGRSVYWNDIAPQNEHPLASIIDALLNVLIILGVLVVFLSGSLIANTMSALLSQHLRQIGVMKLIGARREQVISMYLVLIAAFGIIALLGAIPLGSLGAYRLAQFVAEIINFELSPFHIVPEAILFQVVIALLVPPVAGMLPVIKGARITVQKALSSTGIDGQGGQKGWIDRRLEKLRALSRPMLISIRNTFRRKGRLALTLFTLTLGGGVFISVFNSQVALNDKMAQVTKYFGADVNLDFARAYRIEEVEREALSIGGVERVEVWITSGAEIVHPDGAPSDSISIIAPPADSDLVQPTLQKGRWLLPGDENALAVSDAFVDEFPGLQVGDTLRLKVNGREDDWTVVGIFQYTGMGDLVAYANYDTLAQELKTGPRASVFRIVTAEHTLPYQAWIAAQLNSHFRERGFKVDKVEAGLAFNASITEVLGILTAVLLVMAVLTALVGSIGLTGTMSMNVLERTREIGVMRAVGAHNQIVSGLVIVEGIIIGAISYLLGAILSFPITYLLSNVISIAIFSSPAPWAFTAQGFLIWLGVVVLLSLVASLLPARNASRLTIREVLAYE